MSAIPMMSNVMHCRAHRDVIERNHQDKHNIVLSGSTTLVQNTNITSVNTPPAFNETYKATISVDTTKAFTLLQTTHSNIMEGVQKMFHQNRH